MGTLRRMVTKPVVVSQEVVRWGQEVLGWEQEVGGQGQEVTGCCWFGTDSGSDWGQDVASKKEAGDKKQQDVDRK